MRDALPFSFHASDPDLATGEPGSGIGPRGWLERHVDGAWRRTDPRTEGFVAKWGGRPGLYIFGVGGLDDGAHELRALLFDAAVPGNPVYVNFSFIRDTKEPGVTLSKSQSDIGNVNTATVTVSVAGKISDANVIEKAELSLRKKASADAECSSSPELSQGSSGRTVRNKRDLENDTKAIEFDESFTIRKPSGAGTGPELYCFWLATEDVAVGRPDGNNREDGNMGDYELGSFTVGWPSTPATPPGPTFELTVRTNQDDPSSAAVISSLGVGEGATEGNSYWVALKNETAAPTSTAPVNVSVSAPAGLTLNPTSLTFNGSTDSLQVTITPEHDTDITTENIPVTHSATGFNDVALPVWKYDDDFEITVSPASINEDDGPTEVTVTVTAGEAPEEATTVNVVLGNGTGAEDDDFVGNLPTAAVTIAAGKKSGMTTVSVDAADDAAQDEDGESISLTVTGSNIVGLYYKPASIEVIDDDPDVTLALSQTEVNEDAGAVTITITATADAPVRGITTFQLALGGTANAEDYSSSSDPVSLTINTGATTGSATVTLTISDDAADESDETIIFSDASGAPAGGKTYTAAPVTLKIIDNDDT